MILNAPHLSPARQQPASTDSQATQNKKKAQGNDKWRQPRFIDQITVNPAH